MLARNQRYSFKKGIPAKYLNTDYFSLSYQKNEHRQLTCAFIIGKKVDRRAVVRHRLKRRFASALKEITKDTNVPYDLVFFIKKETSDKQYREIRNQIQKALQQIAMRNRAEDL